MLDAPSRTVLVAQPAPGLPIARLVVGRGVGEVAALLPRLFNLCRSAQSAAVETALGRPVDGAGIGQEILRDHLLKFHVIWPAFFGRPPRPLPDDWEDGGPTLRQRLCGPSGQAPAAAADFLSFLDGDLGYAPLRKKIDGCFAPGEAVAEGLPHISTETIWTVGAAENSVASRVAHLPAMQGIAETHGRGPLWRAAARLFDIDMAIAGRLPEVVSPTSGEAVVPAARGAYALRIRSRGGVVTEFDRVTPTDHLLAEGGVLDRSLASLPSHKTGLGPLLLDILDPCSPVRLKEVRRA